MLTLWNSCWCCRSFLCCLWSLLFLLLLLFLFHEFMKHSHHYSKVTFLNLDIVLVWWGGYWWYVCQCRWCCWTERLKRKGEGEGLSICQDTCTHVGTDKFINIAIKLTFVLNLTCWFVLACDSAAVAVVVVGGVVVAAAVEEAPHTGWN